MIARRIINYSLLLLLVLSSYAIAKKNESPAKKHVSVIFENTKNKNNIAIRKNLKSSEEITDAISLINELFIIKEPFIIRFSDKGDPSFDSENNEIVISYNFITEVKQRFLDDNYSKSGVSIQDAVMDAITHTLFHELGHAFVAIYDLPIVVKEEDAVDAFATIMLIEYFKDGQEVALSAADLFDLESLDIDEFTDEDFWDEHSLDAQRFYSTLCLVYGSSPKKYSFIKKEQQFSKDKADQCIDDYENTLDSWFYLLEDHLRKKS